MEHETTIRPETHALDAFIQATVDRLLVADDRGAASGDGLLFLGNWHDAMPRLIFQDPVLQPVDTRIWGVIKIAAAGTHPAAFPTYKQIAHTANVGSEATVARAMAILRATRWLTLCRRVRDSQGRFRGNIYALHDEPLPLADALFLDQEYIQFLEHAQAHAHPQVRKVTAAVLGTIEEDLHHGGGVENIHPLQRRLEAVRNLQGEPSRFFSFSSRQLQNLKSAPEPGPPQNLKQEPLQKLGSERSSSCSYINIKTTTTTAADPENGQSSTRERLPPSPLAFPPSLTENETRLARICLRNAPQATHQDILDELAGRLLAAKRRNAHIENPIGYLVQLCKAARKGAFTITSPGLQARERRAREAQHKRLEETSRDQALAQMRDLLEDRGQPTPERTARVPGRGDGSAITSSRNGFTDGTAITPEGNGSTDGSAITPEGIRSTDGTAIGPAGPPPDLRCATWHIDVY